MYIKVKVKVKKVRYVLKTLEITHKYDCTINGYIVLNSYTFPILVI